MLFLVTFYVEGLVYESPWAVTIETVTTRVTYLEIWNVMSVEVVAG